MASGVAARRVRRSSRKRSSSAAGDLGDRQRLGAGRGELDGERQAVEVAARASAIAVVGSLAVAAKAVARPGPARRRASAASVVVSGPTATWCSPSMPQRFPAGREDPQPGTPAQHVTDDRRPPPRRRARSCRARRRRPIAEPVDRPLRSARRWRPAVCRRPLRGPDRRRRRPRPRRPARRRAPARRTRPPVVGQPAGELERQPGLADAGRPDDASPGGPADAWRRASASSALATDERRQGDRQRRPARRSGEASGDRRGEGRILGEHGPLEAPAAPGPGSRPSSSRRCSRASR